MVDTRSGLVLVLLRCCRSLVLLPLLFLLPRVWPMLLTVDSGQKIRRVRDVEKFLLVESSRAPMQFAKDVTSQQGGPAREKRRRHAAP